MSDVFEQSLLGKSNEVCLLQDSETFRCDPFVYLHDSYFETFCAVHPER